MTRDHEADAAWRDAWVRCDDRLKRIKKGIDANTLSTSTLQRVMALLNVAESLVQNDGDPKKED